MSAELAAARAAAMDIRTTFLQQRHAERVALELFGWELAELEMAVGAVREWFDTTSKGGKHPHLGEALSDGDALTIASNVVLASRLRRAQTPSGGKS
jgi:hypothetical protein